MRIKRLEIQGFKSFKDKTVVHFDHSITGIVGPNGCGKSNIVDAFFWVMGEQSYKHIRGSGSDDLIFNGSSKYSPLGLAEATLVMETEVPDLEGAASGASTTDTPLPLKLKEVSVTRRVYRSGEGEYFINGVPARLKDIHELFMDTGVGAKGYSVIEQGQIGKIVNAKPEDRRLLIEEAAGIAKYKARKKESLRKMEATHANLSRLNDVVQEIERSLSSLERQAQKARQYRKHKDELLDKELTWGRRKNQVHRQRLDSLKAEREIMEQELLGLRAELQTVENNVEVERVASLTDSKAAESLQFIIQERAQKLTESKSALELSRRRQGDLADQLRSLDAEKAELTSSIGSERERLTVVESELSMLDESFALASETAREIDLEATRGREQVRSVRTDLDRNQRTLMSDLSRTSDLQSKATLLQSRSEHATQQAEKLKAQFAQQEERFASVQEEFENVTGTLADLDARRDGKRSERNIAETELKDSERELSDLDRLLKDQDRKVTMLQSKLNSLEELDRSHEGFADGPKSALDWAKQKNLSASLKAISDDLNVEPGFEGAVQGWLEGMIESLVSDQPSVAKDALSFLEEGKKGRASIFLVDGKSADLSTVKLPSSLPAAEPLVKKIRGASDFVASLFSKVFVVYSLDALFELSASERASLAGVSFVTQSGQALEVTAQGWFRLRGGSLQSLEGASLLTRKQTIEALRTECAEAERTLEVAREARQTVETKVQESQAILQAARAELQEMEIERAGHDRDRIQLEKSVKELKGQIELLQYEMSELEEEAQNSIKERETALASLTEIQARKGDLEAAIQEGEMKLQEFALSLQSVEAKLQEARIQEASLRERTQSSRRELDGGKKLLADRERRLAEIERTLGRASSEHTQHTGGDDELKASIENLTRDLMAAQDELSIIKDRLEQANARLSGSLDRIKTLHHDGDAKVARVNESTLEIEKLSAELSHLIQNLEEKYGQGCLERPIFSPIQEEMTEPVVTAEMSAEEEQLLGEEVERLRERIRRLGEVNVMAIEEFEETKKRYDHLVAERADLEHSIENLKEAIEHINKTSEERFRKAFDAIADRFQRLFPIIFGGGQAKLSLVYPEGSADILEAGVDILAQPPGKKVVNIGLLSGGEKALTAVSLIFAIFMVKPSPFCILDEVDAPLDDANIGKFNALLREMSSKSQFIIITHNKKTMELNDTLYGVTMEEPGVSKMVSIEMH